MKEAIVFLALFALYGCGMRLKAKGRTDHVVTVQGEARIVNIIELRIDVSACDKVSGEAQAQCISESVKALGDLVELAKSLSCKDQECLDSITGGVQ